MVKVDIIDNNYYGHADTLLTINKANVNITFDQLVQTYDGNSKSVSVTLSQNVAYSITYNGSTTLPINSGDYMVVVSVNTNNYAAIDSAIFTINKAHAYFTITDLNFVYDGQTHQPTITVVPNTNYIVKYNGQLSLPQNAGVYNGEILINDTNITGDTTFVFEITNATAHIEYYDTIHVYDGNVKQISLINPDNVNCIIEYKQNGNIVTPVNAGIYDVSISVEEANYDSMIINTQMIIEKATADITFTDDTLTYIYDGTTRSVHVVTTPAGLTVEITYNNDTTAPYQIGVYQVIATIIDNNYQGSANTTLTILEDTKIEETNAIYTAKLYPNPTSDISHLEIEGISGDIVIRIVNSLGQQMMIDKVVADGNLYYDISTGNLTKGVYWIIISYQHNTINKKLIVE